MTVLDIDRRYISRWSSQDVGLLVHVGGVLADADNNQVMATYSRDDNPYTTENESLVIFSGRQADRLDVGTYSVTLSSSETNIPGNYTVQFDYTISGTAQTYQMSLQVGSEAPDYDALSPGWKQIVESVWIRFADLYDSAYGGPHLQTYIQTHFNRNRLAQLLRQAVGRLNTLAQPFATYSVDSPTFPFTVWGPLVAQALYIEVIKHLIRSYVEQPVVTSTSGTSRFDRRDYMDRWQTMLGLETDDFNLGISNFKQAHMGLGFVSVLVSGGAYGRYGPTAYPGGAGQAAARGYFFAPRFY